MQYRNEGRADWKRGRHRGGWRLVRGTLHRRRHAAAGTAASAKRRGPLRRHHRRRTPTPSWILWRTWRPVRRAGDTTAPSSLRWVHAPGAVGSSASLCRIRRRCAARGVNLTARDDASSNQPNAQSRPIRDETPPEPGASNVDDLVEFLRWLTTMVHWGLCKDFRDLLQSFKDSWWILSKVPEPN